MLQLVTPFATCYISLNLVIALDLMSNPTGIVAYLIGVILMLYILMLYILYIVTVVAIISLLQ